MIARPRPGTTATLAGLAVVLAALVSLELWLARTPLPAMLPATGVEALDRSGRLLRAWPVADGRWRLAVSPAEVDARFIDFLLAWEDQRFWRHAGVDPWAMLRAAWQAVRHGRVVSGGSTLSMQVARLLDDGSTGQWRGKWQQVRLALALERRLAKQDILNLYLHLAPYGGNLEGVRAASLAWLGKEPRHLTVAEAALLVALPQAPESRRPDRHPEAARVARNRVLEQLANTGVLAATDAARAMASPTPRERGPMPQLAAHATGRFTHQGRTPVQLTLDANLQSRLETLARRFVSARHARLSTAILVADHHTGQVLAAVGSPGLHDAGPRLGHVDMTQAVRSPGSTLKPMVYALAFERGLVQAQTRMHDRAMSFGGYRPENFDGRYWGEMSVAEALQQSRNVPVVQLLQRLGPARLMLALRRSGVEAQLPGVAPGLAVGLGGVGVTLEGLVTLYGMMAQDGVARPLVWQPGSVRPQGERVLAPRNAWLISHLLAQIAPPPGHGLPGRIAFKTGTSYGYRDAWALGFDGRHVVGVWTGRADGTPVPGALGAQAAAPLLFEIFGHLGPRPVALPPPPPDARIASHAELPPALQYFGRNPRDGAELQIAFPPNGARLALADASPEVSLKLQRGRPPYTVLVAGRPLPEQHWHDHLQVPLASRGFSTIAVIDARGSAARVQVEWPDAPSPGATPSTAPIRP